MRINVYYFKIPNFAPINSIVLKLGQRQATSNTSYTSCISCFYLCILS